MIKPICQLLLAYLDWNPPMWRHQTYNGGHLAMRYKASLSEMHKYCCSLETWLSRCPPSSWCLNVVTFSNGAPLPRTSSACSPLQLGSSHIHLLKVAGSPPGFKCQSCLFVCQSSGELLSRSLCRSQVSVPLISRPLPLGRDHSHVTESGQYCQFSF